MVEQTNKTFVNNFEYFVEKYKKVKPIDIENNRVDMKNNKIRPSQQMFS